MKIVETIYDLYIWWENVYCQFDPEVIDGITYTYTHTYHIHPNGKGYILEKCVVSLDDTPMNTFRKIVVVVRGTKLPR